jgi:hypothetical protein
MNAKSIIKQIAAVLGASIVLAAGAAQAADGSALVDQLKQTDGNIQLAAAHTVASLPAIGVNNLSTGRAEKAAERQAVDVSSPSYRKFLEEVFARSGA